MYDESDSRGGALCEILWADSQEFGSKQSLSAEDQELARTFLFQPRRRQFETGRTLVRRFFSQKLGLSPENLRIAVDATGKPFLLAEGLGLPYQFSIAHSGRIVVCAFSKDIRLGVDIERVRRSYDWLRTACAVLTADEINTLLAYSPSRRARAFYKLWTKNEALAKATRTGISQTVRSRRKSAVEVGKPDVSGWTSAPVKTRSSYVGTVVVESVTCRFETRQEHLTSNT